MNCKIVEVQQGSEEWDHLRSGRITASRIGDVMARPTTKRYRGYRKEKVLELLGYKENAEESPEWARHGRDLESRAIGAYEWRFDVETTHNIFLIHKEHEWLACSPDFLVLPGLDEGGEVKCRKRSEIYREKRMAAELQALGPERFQVQTALMLTGFEYWWFVNYYHGPDSEGHIIHKLHRTRIYRDDALINQIERRCIQFWEEVQDLAQEDGLLEIWGKAS